MKLRSARIAAASCLVALSLATGLAGVATANTRDAFTIEDVVQDTFSCGAVATIHILGRGTASFAGDGTWLGTTIHITYQGQITDPATGRTISGTTHQIVAERDGTVTMRGQGFFVRAPGFGVVVYDVGRLVFDPSTGSTISATPKVIPFDDPDSAATVDAAVCSLFD
jgi:hypothetical protein